MSQLIELRTKNGVCIADLTGRIAEKFVRNVLIDGLGHMTTKNIVGMGVINVLLITTSSSYTIGVGTKIYLFEGTYAKLAN